MTAPCGHEDCGLLCDRAILAERLALRQAGGHGRSLTVEHIRAEGLRGIRRERAKELLREGRQTRMAIARQTGLSHQQVVRLAEAIGVEVVRVQLIDDQEEARRILALHAEGGSLRSMAKELGMSKDAVACLTCAGANRATW